MTKVSWPGQDNIDEYSWIDEQGNLHLKSIDDGLCEVILAANCLHFRVQFLYLLPYKKAQWVSTDPNLQTMGDQQPVDDCMSAYRSQYTLSQFNKSHLTHYSNNQGTRMMRMMYEYCKMEQIHSVAQCPDRWAYPIQLLMRLKKLDLHTELAILPVQSMFSGCTATELVRGREYSTPLPVDVSLRTAEDRPVDVGMNSTIVSNQSM